MPPEPKQNIQTNNTVRNQPLDLSSPRLSSTINNNTINRQKSNTSIRSNQFNPENSSSNFRPNNLNHNQHVNRGNQGGGYSMGYSGMGMGMGYGMYGAPFMTNGPISWVYSINYFVSAIGQMYNIIGMNAHAIYELYYQIKSSFNNILKVVRDSEIRKWLQRKTKKSKLLRYIVVASIMILSSQIVRLMRLIYDNNSRNNLIENSLEDYV